jgi:hypothetical protein
MNLWARTTLRQLTMLAVALFFFSCEDETSILGFKNPNEKFKVGYIDIPLNASRLLAIDSLITDLRPISQNNPVDGILVGEYTDPDFGKITARSFMSVYPTSSAAFASTAEYDSMTIHLRLNFYGYGSSGEQVKRVGIHEITSDTLTLFNGNRYYGSSPAPEYSADALGEAVITVNMDTLIKKASVASSRQDTLLATGRLNDDFGRRVFEAIKGGLATNDAQRLFRSQIKGFALVPAESNGILGFNVISGTSLPGQLSRVILHYHTETETGAVDDTLARTFGFDFASFTKYETDRLGTEVDALQPYQSAEPLSDQRYIQSGAPIVTKLDLAPFYVFADSVENVLINEAQLVIENVAAPAGLNPHNALMLQFINNTSDVFLSTKITADGQLASNYFAVPGTQVPSLPLGFENYYFAAIEGPQAPVPATISYDADTDQYSGLMTIFAQSLLMNKKEDRLKYLALMPASPEVTRSITRTVFQKDNVRLRVFYTRAKTANP